MCTVASPKPDGESVKKRTGDFCRHLSRDCEFVTSDAEDVLGAALHLERRLLRMRRDHFDRPECVVEPSFDESSERFFKRDSLRRRETDSAEQRSLESGLQEELGKELLCLALVSGSSTNRDLTPGVGAFTRCGRSPTNPIAYDGF